MVERKHADWFRILAVRWFVRVCFCHLWWFFHFFICYLWWLIYFCKNVHYDTILSQWCDERPKSCYNQFWQRPSTISDLCFSYQTSSFDFMNLTKFNYLLSDFLRSSQIWTIFRNVPLFFRCWLTRCGYFLKNRQLGDFLTTMKF